MISLLCILSYPYKSIVLTFLDYTVKTLFAGSVGLWLHEYGIELYHAFWEAEKIFRRLTLDPFLFSFAYVYFIEKPGIITLHHFVFNTLVVFGGSTFGLAFFYVVCKRYKCLSMFYTTAAVWIYILILTTLLG